MVLALFSPASCLSPSGRCHLTSTRGTVPRPFSGPHTHTHACVHAFKKGVRERKGEGKAARGANKIEGRRDNYVYSKKRVFS